MQIKNTTARFGTIAILFHWSMAVIMIGLVVTGLYMTRIAVSVFKLELYGWHKEWGFLLLMLVMLRIVWRLNNINPSLSMLSTWEKFAARSVHWLFYLLMFALPLSGWLVTSATGFPVSFFGLFIMPNLIAPNEEQRLLFTQIHQWLAYGLIFIFCGHVGAALKHHYINKDDILRRII